MTGRPEPKVETEDVPVAGEAAEAAPGAAPGAGAGAGRATGPAAEGAPEQADDGGDDGGAILTDVVALAAERDEYLSALQRLKADFDNYRKRVVRQQEEQAARAEGGLVTKLLPVLDNLDLAWVHLGDDTEEARAIAQARGQLLDVLGKEGLERVDAAAVPFDPVVHDAVAHAPAGAAGAAGAAEPAAAAAAPEAEPEPAPGAATGDVPPGVGPVVDEVMRAGYRWRGQVLRPAMVRVRG